MSQTTIDSGQRANLTMTLTNPTSSPITLHFSDGCQVLAYVTSLTGAVVAPAGGGWACTQVLTELTIGAGETKTFTWGWKGGMDFATELPEAGGVPAGQYYFYATMIADEGTFDTPRYVITLK